MPPDRRSGSISALLSLALLCSALWGCDAGGQTGGGSTEPRAKTASRSVRIPPLPEPFDSTGCHFHGATYRPHPDSGGDELLSQLLKIERLKREDGAFYEAGLVFEARDRRSGALATSLRMKHTTGIGLVRQGAYTENESISLHVLHINRDLGFGEQGDVPKLELPAPYALEFTDLQSELRNRDWDSLGAAVTYHTRTRSEPDFRNRWLLQSCGGR